MTRFTMTSGLRKAAVASAGFVLAAAGVLASTGPASAGTTLKVNYPVTGSTLIKAANFNLALGPGTLASKVNLAAGTFTATLSLPNATGSFNELGIVPVTATTEFINKGKTTGTIDPTTGAISSTSNIVLKLISVSIAGIPVPVGNKCESATPATIQVDSQPGFSILAGGNLAGTYTIPPFANCGLATPVLNLTIPGSGNTITL